MKNGQINKLRHRKINIKSLIAKRKMKMYKNIKYAGRYPNGSLYNFSIFSDYRTSSKIW